MNKQQQTALNMARFIRGNRRIRKKSYAKLTVFS
ncbi:Rop family plasmid primer RNA-binding protein [Escherichia coli]|nr:Rop family plasmid primer RNA-binding protein [Escherichia coli]